ncbi:hypothetical protein [Flexivirga alba]|uniref:Uncharacterized protein n=1 Tax=Flexivirga alba TaxID=702742 RepID=A0ABW2AGG9_9MICO
MATARIYRGSTMGNRSYLISSAGLELETNNSEALYWRSLLTPEVLERSRPAWESAETEEDPPVGLTAIVLTVGEARAPMARFGALIAEQLPEQNELYGEFARAVGDAPNDARVTIEYEELAWFTSHAEFFADLVNAVRATANGDLSWVTALQDNPISEGFGFYGDDSRAGDAWRASAAEAGLT